MGRILIVDDDPGALEMFARVLRLEGYHVDTAEDGLSGLLNLPTSVPDAILLDLRMPDVDGLEFLRRLRATEAYRQTPVAVVTGVQPLDEALVEELYDLGADLRFKPLWFEEIIMLVQTLLKK
jgi:DNA-binding response OmpR family regulator